MSTPEIEYIPYARPFIGQEEIDEVVEALRSGWVTTGPRVRQFESDIAALVEADHVIAVNSCTAGLHLALAALDIGPGDEVILPSLTFCATANVVVHLGATPVLVDIAEDFLVDAEIIERAITSRTRAVIPVHYGGQACDLEPIYALAEKHGLAVIEDGAHVIGSRYRGHRIGSKEHFGELAAGVRSAVVYSFYATKNMTTGEGGVVATSDKELADRVRLLSLHGMSKDAWKRYTAAGSWYYEVVEAGFKVNMTDIQAALGIHQLRRLEGFIETRQRYAAYYDEAFEPLPEVETPRVRPNRMHPYHLYAIRLKQSGLSIDRADFIEEMTMRKIGTSVHYIPVHLHPFYGEKFGYGRGDLPNTDLVYDEIVSLPLYPSMTETELERVATAVIEIVASNRRSSPVEDKDPIRSDLRSNAPGKTSGAGSSIDD